MNWHITGYPYRVPISAGKYTIQENTYPLPTVIYSGNAYKASDIDLSSILSETINVPDMSLNMSKSSHTSGGNTVKNISIIDSANKTNTSEWVWGYDRSHLNYTDTELLSDYITPEIYSGSIIPVTWIYTGDIRVDFKVSGRVIGTTLGDGTTTDTVIRTDTARISKSLVAADNTPIEIIYNDAEVLINPLKYKSCIPPNTYTLYYINLRGGLSMVHCTAKNTQKNSITRNNYETETFNDRPYEFATKSYLNTVQRKWTLNTPLLNSNQSTLIQDLFMSPRVWLYKIGSDPIAVNITDKEVEYKIKDNVRVLNYTIQIEESSKYNVFS